jgi:hypothetical protein
MASADGDNYDAAFNYSILNPKNWTKDLLMIGFHLDETGYVQLMNSWRKCLEEEGLYTEESLNSRDQKEQMRTFINKALNDETTTSLLPLTVLMVDQKWSKAALNGVAKNLKARLKKKLEREFTTPQKKAKVSLPMPHLHLDNTDRIVIVFSSPPKLP